MFIFNTDWPGKSAQTALAYYALYYICVLHFGDWVSIFVLPSYFLGAHGQLGGCIQDSVIHLRWTGKVQGAFVSPTALLDCVASHILHVELLDIGRCESRVRSSVLDCKQLFSVHVTELLRHLLDYCKEMEIIRRQNGLSS